MAGTTTHTTNTRPTLTRTRRSFVVLSVLVLLVSACGGDSVSQSDRQAEPTPIAAPSGVGVDGAQLTLEVVDGGPATGLLITDHRGLAVYGVTGETPTDFICVGECTGVWIPLVPRDAAVAAALDVSQYGTTVRPDGTAQATYKNIPLYLWSGDTAVGITGGAGVAGTWFALTETGGFTSS